jgi:hypothetical protein
MTPNINLHIERIVLDGIRFTPQEQRQFRAVVESELTRLLVERGMSSDLQTAGALRSVPAQPIHVVDRSPAALGQQVAQSIYGGIGHETSR